MEGPTPVSALIHAATMVTAGVYMVARCTPLFVAVARRAARRGGRSAASPPLLAGVIAMTQTDLKRVLAYSTISQLGYMFLGLGVGTLAGITAGMFHLFTHAFFKALLFLGAGSVMHAMGGVIDMRRFGGLRRLMPDHALDVPVRLPGAGRRRSVRRLLEQGRDPGRRARAGRTTSRCSTVLYWVGAVHGLPDGLLHLPRLLPHVLRRRARAARGRASCPRVAAGDDGAAGDPGRLRAGRRRLLRVDAAASPTCLATRRRWPTQAVADDRRDEHAHESHTTGRASISTRDRAGGHRRGGVSCTWAIAAQVACAARGCCGRCTGCRTASCSSTRFTTCSFVWPLWAVGAASAIGSIAT